MLDDHNSKTLENFLLKTTLSTIDSIKRDCTNEVQKYKHEKLTLISKFERMKQQWSEMFKPQYVFRILFNLIDVSLSIFEKR